MAESTQRVDLAALAQSFVDPAQDRAVKRGYLRWFPPGARVLDLGCGHGAFLDVARAAGVEARGVDASPAAVAACRARGLRAEVGDVVEALHSGPFDGVLLAHVIEHLPPARAAEWFTALAAALPPGGRAVVVTPNVRNLIVLEQTFWLDATHVRPYPRPLLERMGRAAGLDVVASFDDPATRPVRSWSRRFVAWLRSCASGADRSGPMDAVVVYERGGVPAPRPPA